MATHSPIFGLSVYKPFSTITRMDLDTGTILLLNYFNAGYQLRISNKKQKTKIRRYLSFSMT